MGLLQKSVNEINGGGKLSGMTGHYDGGWFEVLNGAPCVCYGPGNITCAHSRNEFCEVQQLIDYTKALISCCLEWCN